ncbi:MAG TPA: SDR family oxidoreductase [Gammaproteobacteria bacterium]|nr:SDR family oxidoreductase [Gammaproteobacteria bacterium]HIL96601.1 SDR family oxidoreductase [Pseudomonadales bacterium]
MTKGTALITGASSGIGEALARQFAANGFDLVITARRLSKLEEIGDELRSLVNVDVIDCDLSTNQGIDHLVSSLSDTRIDVLVNNAGIAYPGSFHDQALADIENLIALNIFCLTRLTRNFLPGMINRGSGRILNVASVASFQPVPSLSAYAASKAYVLSLTESLSEELKGTGVFVTALCPGITRTDMIEDVQSANVPAFLMSSPEDVAQQGYAALMNREVIRIPGVTNQAAITWAKHQPRWLVRGIGGLMARLNPNR